MQKRGIYVAMIGRVLRECAPYFLMLFGITIAFGFAMSVVLQEYSWDFEYFYNERLDKLELEDYTPTRKRFETLITGC